MPKKILKGVVKSVSSANTIIVSVSRNVKHPLYGKIIKRSKSYPSHTDATHAVGDEVQIQECMPISKTKRFRVLTASQEVA